MHRTIMVTIVSGYTFCGITTGMGHQAGAAGRNPAVMAERDLQSAQLTSFEVPAGPNRQPLPGFDTCKTPSLRTMRAWRARFSAIGIYIGGEDKACAYGYLSRTWVQTVKAMGWSLLPNFVGPQPPCDSFPGRIRPKQAAAQGRVAADHAIADAKMLGIGRGSPIYYDMEAYKRTKGRCVHAVLTFLDAWTRRLNARGYLSGVYSSADAAIINLQRDTRINGHKLAKPQAVWIALWDNRKNVSAPVYLPHSLWPADMRSKQYLGPHWVRVGGIQMNIDFDMVGGPVVHQVSRPPKRHRAKRKVTA
jgi:Rv2525c-like, glycoside hydrolase-like domain